MGWRYGKAVENTNPGPGAYTPNFRDRGPYVSIKNRYLRRNADSGPGPSTYRPLYENIAMSAPAYTMGGRHDIPSAAT